ncbi:MAG: hypothetical protein Q8K78_14055 [Planctomycetaceae bacterium]|nr:hypothetical protein [Planctomycetaceae bacterium]
MDDPNAEMLSLLREIRDLQKKHFERYVEFTSRVLEQQKIAAEEQRKNAERADEDTATALEEQRRIGQIARQAAWMTPVIAVLLGIALFFTAWILFGRQLLNTP